MLDWQQPSNLYLLQFLTTLSLASLAALVAFKNTSRPGEMLKFCGVKMRKIARAVREIDRKVFHLCGLLVPLIHQLLLRHDFSSRFCVGLCVLITTVGWAADTARLNFDTVARHWPLASILREEEKTHRTGACFFSLGCTLCIALSPPSIAMASILFLVLGDMSAAIIGVSFGGETVSMKLGRGGKKSIEGSSAMFLVCFVIGCSVFASVRLREYPVFFGALTATLTELFEPLHLNDNLTIPLLSSMVMQWAFARISTCSSGSDPSLEELSWVQGWLEYLHLNASLT
mmetsp:Transcript_59802/g.129632  ORF Transcript_59802/g.129632 Transcript_59802/m.129632 type:complete len:287 (+) Transcript_59802:320-1180(+)